MAVGLRFFEQSRVSLSVMSVGRAIREDRTKVSDSERFGPPVDIAAAVVAFEAKPLDDVVVPAVAVTAVVAGSSVMNGAEETTPIKDWEMKCVGVVAWFSEPYGPVRFSFVEPRLWRRAANLSIR